MKLSYLEPNPDTNLQETVDFEWICPRSARIAQHQAEIVYSPGLTMVAFLDCPELDKMLENLRNELENNDYEFTKIRNLHSTLLGLFEPEQDIKKRKPDLFYEPVYRAIKEYINTARPKSMKLEFDHIRPGTWRSGKETNRKQISHYSNGTIFATGHMIGDNKRFCELGRLIADYLKKEVDYIFEPNFKRKFPNLSVTLGYFSTIEDFKISKKMYNLFQDLRNLDISCEIKDLRVVKYWRRTLENYILYRDPLFLY